MVTKKRKTTKRKARKTTNPMAMPNMDKMMGTAMGGIVAVTGLGITAGLAGSVIGAINK
jgi:predicted lipid-binding transport protein (Tim44 family)